MSKYLTYQERLEIEACLKENLSFGVIALKLNKNRTTIAKEIKRHIIAKKTGYSGWPYNACKHRPKCKRKNICPKGECRRASATYCKLCSYCNDGCPDFEEQVCISKFKPPYVCNGCRQLDKCTLTKVIYDAVDACLLDVRNIDLPRKVKYRPRYKKSKFKVDKGCRIGRNYSDFQIFIYKHPDYAIVQMDSVIGNKGGKVLLTIHFVNTSFMIAFLRKANTSQSVIDVFNQLYELLGKEIFKKLFPVILTDNGSEFSNPQAIEFAPDGTRKTSAFYCDPSAPYQKGSIEVNHELIRRILPKGTSFDAMTQETVCLIMNNINSYTRKKLNEKNPYQAFSFYYGENLPCQMGYVSVSPEDIILTRKLLKK